MLNLHSDTRLLDGLCTLLLIKSVYDISNELYTTLERSELAFVSKIRTSMASLNPNSVSPITASLCDDTNLFYNNTDVKELYLSMIRFYCRMHYIRLHNVR